MSTNLSTPWWDWRACCKYQNRIAPGCEHHAFMLEEEGWECLDCGMVMGHSWKPWDRRPEGVEHCIHGAPRVRPVRGWVLTEDGTPVDVNEVACWIEDHLPEAAGTAAECELLMRQLTAGERGCSNPSEHGASR